MNSTEQKFNDLGIDAVTGVEMMEWLGVSPVDLSDPLRFSRLHEIINYFKQFPEDTQRYLVRKAVNGKNVDRLQHVWEYTSLLKKKDAAEKGIEKIKSEASAVGDDADEYILSNLAQREHFLREDLKGVKKELDIYEK